MPFFGGGKPGISIEAVREQLEGSDVLRAKGFVRTAEGVRLVQVMGRRIELEAVERDPAPELLNRVVVIRRSR